MTNINLLPWREELREARKKAFFVTLGLVVAFGGVCVFLADRYVNGEIDNQNARNEYLQQQISVLDTRIAEINEIREQKARLTERMTVIQDLEGTRPIIVRLFDELVRTLPDDVYYSNVSRTGESIRLNGFAESSTLVSELMRRLEASDWFANPVLGQVAAAPGAPDNTSNQFVLTVNVTTPQPELEEQ